MSDSDMAKRIKELRLSLGLTLEEVANEAGSFNYEFVCGIGKRVPRVYIRNGEMKETEYFEK